MLRRDLPPGVRRHGAGYQATVKYRGVRSYLTFPIGYSNADMREAIDAAYADLVTDRGERPEAGTFAADAERYLRAVRSMPSFQDREKHTREWVAVFGRQRRRTIKADEIRAQLGGLKAKGYAGSSLNKRRTALMHFYTTLDGRARVNPVKDVPKYAERDPGADPRGLPREVAVLLLRAIKPGKTRCRLQLIRWTGLPPEQLRQVEARHLDYEAATVIVARRKKGRGVKATTLPLLPQAVRWFRALEYREGLGAYNDRAMRETIRRARHRILRRAAKRVGKRTVYRISALARWWLEREERFERIRPYDFRHTFGTMLRYYVPDPRTRGDLMLHADTRTGARYEQAAANPVARAALDQLSSALRGAPRRAAVQGKA